MFKLPYHDIEQSFVNNKLLCTELLKLNDFDFELYGTQITISYVDRIPIFFAQYTTIAEKIQNLVLQDLSEEEIIRKTLISLINKEFGNFDIPEMLKLCIAIILSITSKSRIDYPFEIIDIDFIKSTKTVKLILKPLISLLSYKSIVILFSSLSYILEELHVNEVFQYKTEDIELILNELNALEKSSLWNKEEIIYQFLIRLNFLIETTADKESRTNYQLLMFVLKAIFFEIDYFRKICNYFALNRWNVLFTTKKEYIFTTFNSNILIESKPFFPVISSLPNSGFRIICGKARNIGFGTIAVNPVVLLVLKFLTIGDQIKLSNPFANYQVQVNDSLEGPYVQFKDQSCRRINSMDDFKSINTEIQKILSLGDLLIDEFDVPGSLATKPLTKDHFSWVDEFVSLMIQTSEDQRKKLEGIFGTNFNFGTNFLFLSSLKLFLQNSPFEITAYRSVELYKQFKIPIHPKFTPRWTNISIKNWRLFRSWIRKTRYKETVLNGQPVHQIIGELDLTTIEVLRKGEIPFTVKNEKIMINDYGSILYFIFLDKSTDLGELEPGDSFFNPISYLNSSNKIKFFLEETLKVNSSLNSINSASIDSIKENIHGFYAEPSNEEEINSVTSFIKEIGYNLSIEEINFLKSDLNGSSEHKRFELLKKTVLRAKHKLPIFKDGLIHFSVINAPLSVFKASEINITLEQLHALGYYYDIDGKKIISINQELLLKPSDIIIPKSLLKGILSVMAFVNDEMKFLFNKGPFYKLNNKELSIIGTNVIGINNNFSVGVYGRIIGYSDASVCYASPLWHLSKGSYCNGEMTDSIVLDSDCFLNLDISLLATKVGMFRGIPIFTQIEPDLEIATATLEKTLIENGYKERRYQILTQSPPNTETNDIIRNLLTHNSYNRFSSYYLVNEIADTFEKNVLTGITDPLERLNKFLLIQMGLETINIDEIFNDSIRSFVKLIILQEINTLFKNPFICTSCGTKIDLLINPICNTCHEPIIISGQISVIESKLKQMRVLIKKFEQITLDDSTKNIILYADQQLKVA